jgi:hypothetical protein
MMERDCRKVLEILERSDFVFFSKELEIQWQFEASPIPFRLHPRT